MRTKRWARVSSVLGLRPTEFENYICVAGMLKAASGNLNYNIFVAKYTLRNKTWIKFACEDKPQVMPACIYLRMPPYLIFVICSPHTQFFCTQKHINRDNTDFLIKHCKVQQNWFCNKTPQMGHIIYLVMVKERTDVRYATNMRNMNARMICELLVARRYASCHVLDWMNLANWGN